MNEQTAMFSPAPAPWRCTSSLWNLPFVLQNHALHMAQGCEAQPPQAQCLGESLTPANLHVAVLGTEDDIGPDHHKPFAITKASGLAA